MWGGGRSSLPLPLPLPRTRNAIFPPTHHSPLGGQSLAKLSTKIKLRCRFLPIALNRADWIRISLFSSHLDHLVDGAPEKVGTRWGRGRGSERLPSTFQLWNLRVRVWDATPTPNPFPRGKFIPCLCTLLSGLGRARLASPLLGLFLANSKSCICPISVWHASCSPTCIPLTASKPMGKIKGKV